MNQLRVCDLLNFCLKIKQQQPDLLSNPVFVVAKTKDGETKFVPAYVATTESSKNRVVGRLLKKINDEVIVYEDLRTDSEKMRGRYDLDYVNDCLNIFDLSGKIVHNDNDCENGESDDGTVDDIVAIYI